MALPMPSYALWLDLETTGTDEGLDPIIEVGVVLTHVTPLFPAIDSLNRVITPPPAEPDCECGSLVAHRLGLNPAVRRMHEANGLLAEIAAGRSYPIAEAEIDILKWLDALTAGARVVLAGSGVGHFDRRFLRAQMPGLDRRLVHYPLDVGVIRRFFRVAGVSTAPLSEDESKTHRALDDVHAHIAEARKFAAMLMGVAA